MCSLRLQDYMKSTKELYNAELEPVDFKTKYEAARVNINSWVEEQTQGLSHTLTYTPSIYRHDK